MSSRGCLVLRRGCALLVALASAGGQGCESAPPATVAATDGGPTVPEGDVRPLLRPGVVVLSREGALAARRTGSRFEIPRAEADRAGGIRAGSVVVAGVGAAFLLRVRAVYVMGSTLVCDVEDAYLTDVFEQADIHFAIQRAPLDGPDHLSIDIHLPPGFSLGGGDPLPISFPSAYVRMAPTPRFDIRIRDHETPRMSLSLDLAVEAELVARLELAGVERRRSFDQTLPYPFSCTPVHDEPTCAAGALLLAPPQCCPTYVVWVPSIPPVPIPIEIQIGAKISAEVHASATVGVSAGVHASLSGGASLTYDGSFHAVSRINPPTLRGIGPMLDASAEAGFTATLTPFFRLAPFYVGGVGADVLFPEVVGTASMDGCAQVTIQTGVDLAAELNLFHVVEASYTRELFRFPEMPHVLAQTSACEMPPPPRDAGVDVPPDVRPVDVPPPLDVPPPPDVPPPTDVPPPPPDVCAAGLNPCRGACVDFATDAANCGACARACGAGEACSAGSCAAVCAPPRMVCGSACVDVGSDTANCGRCSNRCATGWFCSGGVCMSSCAFTLCGGACVDLATSASNCGACARACATCQTCSGGRCVAVANDCSGRSCGASPSGCFSCGTCPGGQTCGSGGRCCTTCPAGSQCGTDSCGTPCGAGCGTGCSCNTSATPYTCSCACTAPGAPGGVSASGAGAGSVRVTWSGVSGATGYLVLQHCGAGTPVCPGDQVGSVLSAGTTSATVSCATGRLCTYAVCAQNACGARSSVGSFVPVTCP